uniref:Uncharacterized protein n=1 Tax=Lepeophtheirus salmonis TaxID=72036 RepID=A0A0K2TRG9_LEPSM
MNKTFNQFTQASIEAKFVPPKCFGHRQEQVVVVTCCQVQPVSLMHENFRSEIPEYVCTLALS